RQELGTPRRKPAFLRQSLALRAMAVTAGVIDVALSAARVTLCQMSAQGCGAARGDGTHRAVLHRHQTVHLLILRTVTLEDMRELEPIACRSRMLRQRAHARCSGV